MRFLIKFYYKLKKGVIMFFMIKIQLNKDYFFILLFSFNNLLITMKSINNIKKIDNNEVILDNSNISRIKQIKNKFVLKNKNNKKFICLKYNNENKLLENKNKTEFKEDIIFKDDIIISHQPLNISLQENETSLQNVSEGILDRQDHLKYNKEIKNMEKMGVRSSLNIEEKRNNGILNLLRVSLTDFQEVIKKKTHIVYQSVENYIKKENNNETIILDASHIDNLYTNNNNIELFSIKEKKNQIDLSEGVLQIKDNKSILLVNDDEIILNIKSDNESNVVSSVHIEEENINEIFGISERLTDHSLNSSRNLQNIANIVNKNICKKICVSFKNILYIIYILSVIIIIILISFYINYL
jgi:hypothetical protein